MTDLDAALRSQQAALKLIYETLNRVYDAGNRDEELYNLVLDSARACRISVNKISVRIREQAND